MTLDRMHLTSLKLWDTWFKVSNHACAKFHLLKLHMYDIWRLSVWLFKYIKTGLIYTNFSIYKLYPRTATKKAQIAGLTNFPEQNDILGTNLPAKHALGALWMLVGGKCCDEAATVLYW